MKIYIVLIWQNLINKVHFLHYLCFFIPLHLNIRKRAYSDCLYAVRTPNLIKLFENVIRNLLHCISPERKRKERTGEERKWVRLCRVVCFKKCPSAMMVGADGACNGCSVHRNKLGSGWSIANRVSDISTEQLTRQEVGQQGGGHRDTWRTEKRVMLTLESRLWD